MVVAVVVAVLTGVCVPAASLLRRLICRPEASVTESDASDSMLCSKRQFGMGNKKKRWMGKAPQFCLAQSSDPKAVLSKVWGRRIQIEDEFNSYMRPGFSMHQNQIYTIKAWYPFLSDLILIYYFLSFSFLLFSFAIGFSPMLVRANSILRTEPSMAVTPAPLPGSAPANAYHGIMNFTRSLSYFLLTIN